MAAAEKIATAALTVCETFSFPSDDRIDLNSILREALGDKAFVNLEAGVCASLVAACRAAIRRAPPAGVERDRRMDYAICEVLSALWTDTPYIEAWKSSGHSEELAKRCPLGEIVGGARFALGYGDSNAQRMYFSNFSRMSTHASMMSDDVRTGAYYRAILQNRADFEGKVVMDVGSGSGILGFFCARAGASKVYCIEASPMERVIRRLAEANGLSDRIVVVNKVLQEISDQEVPEKVDVIVSETLGNCLFAERGIETVVVARERFLKPEGTLFPCKAILLAAPFCDEARHKSRMTESLHFWTYKDFFGLDMTSALDMSRTEIFKRPLGDTFHPDQLKADPVMREFDFRTLRSEELARFTCDYNFLIKDTCVVHGLACWFEAIFEGSHCNLVLSTSPWDTLTHWWQTRFMLLEPLGVNDGQKLQGSLLFEATEKNTYDCTLVMEANGIQRQQDVMCLLDIDTAHRKFSYVEKEIPGQTSRTKSGRVVSLKVPDYRTTKAEPTTGKELVFDPLRDLKAEAEKSLQAATGRNTNGDSSTNTDRPYGSQIKVNNKTFIMVDEPELGERMTQNDYPLCTVGSFEDSMILTPQAHPYSFLIQYFKNGATGMTTRVWMEEETCAQHCKAWLFDAQSKGTIKPKPELTQQEVDAWTLQQLWSFYDHTKKRTLQK